MELVEGQQVQYLGKTYEVFKVMEFYVGLIDLEKPLIRDERKNLCAHIAVRKTALEMQNG